MLLKVTSKTAKVSPNNASSCNFTAIIGVSAGLGNKPIQHKQTDNLKLAHAPASFSVSLELAHNITKSM